MSAAIRIGLISDTHGLLRPQVHEVFAGVSQILHAGDVCSDTILMELGLIAPTQAVPNIGPNRLKQPRRPPGIEPA